MTESPKIWSEAISTLNLKKPSFFPETASLRECIDYMQANHETFLLLVNDQEKMVGVFTERDVVSCYWAVEIDDSTPVMAVMNRKIMTTSPNTSILEAVSVMGANEVSQLPVLDKNKKVSGVLTVETLLENLSESFPDDLLNLPPKKSFPQQRNGG